LPLVDKFLKAVKVKCEMYLIPWFYTFFSNSFHINLISQLFDIFLLQGDVVFFRISLSILKIAQRKLVKCNADSALIFLMFCTNKINKAEILHQVRNHELTKKEFI